MRAIVVSSLVNAGLATTTPTSASAGYAVKYFGLNACKGQCFSKLSKGKCAANGGSTVRS